MPLTDRQIRSLKTPEKPKKVSDGAGLHLLLTPNGSRLWRLSYRFAGSQKTLALGAYPYVSLAVAARNAIWQRASSSLVSIRLSNRRSRKPKPRLLTVTPSARLPTNY
jgi:hypothetical protein